MTKVPSTFSRKELDALIAEKVMGGIRPKNVNQITNFDVSAGTITVGGVWQYPRYSADIAAAWEVVEKLSSKGYTFECAYQNDGIVGSISCMITFVSLSNEEIPTTMSSTYMGDSVPLAICLAALQIVGHKLEVK
jgi:hypothetical protein